MRCYQVALATLILGLLQLALFGGCSAPNPNSEARAAIIDQLYLFEPNPAFIDQVSAELKSCGFEVDVHRGKKISVDFYRELPKYGYQLIIFRAHSGLMHQRQDSRVTVKGTTYLFTGEAYNKIRHVREQLDDQVLSAEMIGDYPLVFAVNSKFLLNSMKGRFKNTAIIMMGCSTTYLNDMATAFVLKGASTYLGWDSGVNLRYVDRATEHLIHNLYVENLTVQKAVAKTMTQDGPDPLTRASLKYFPAKSGSQTIMELVKGDNLPKAEDR